MKRSTFALCLLFLAGSFSGKLIAQEKPFAAEIAAFKQQDRLHAPAKGGILFVGSSSFRKWQDVQQYFPGYSILNRGFGGSAFPDLIYYAPQIIFPYEPKQVVIYCGDNDLASSDEVTAKVVFDRFKTLFDMIRTKLPNTEIAFVSIKPSPSRMRLLPQVEESNRLVKEFLAKQKNTGFIDVFHVMLAGNGRPIPSIFESDSLHMNAGGYALWKKAIQPYLIK